ncbi:peroxiredoxin [Bartonella sp. DGB2]|uniref:peroxiredoxin n=1 Tax=Bartonella sp. DGB2 TaxID=3388426 RepID=UPI00398FC815
MTVLKTGDIAPIFILNAANADSTEQTISLVALRGQWVVLYCYPKDDTSGCTVEAQDFTALKQEFDALKVAVFGLSPDSIAKHHKFIKKYALNIPLLSDEEKTTLCAYGVWIEKNMYGRKYMGVERSTFLIDPEGKIAQLWSKVSVPNHANAVLSAVRQHIGQCSTS